MRTFRELESSSLYVGLGVQLIDDFASVPADNYESPLIGTAKIEVDIDDGGTWRALEMETLRTSRTAAGVVWFPWLEHYRDARGMAPRKYRVRVTAAGYRPRYEWDAAGAELDVFPYDDVNPPATLPAMPLKIRLLPASTYPFPDSVPVLRGIVVDQMTAAPVPDALVSWIDASLQTDAVLTDSDGEFSLPMRRAPTSNTPIDVQAELPFGGPTGVIIVRLPQDLPNVQTIQIS